MHCATENQVMVVAHSSFVAYRSLQLYVVSVVYPRQTKSKVMFVGRDATVLLKLPHIVRKNKGGQVWRVCRVLNVTGENICH